MVDGCFQREEQDDLRKEESCGKKRNGWIEDEFEFE